MEHGCAFRHNHGSPRSLPLELHLAEWEEIASDLRTGPLLVDLIRPTEDWDAIRAKVSALRTALLRQLSQSIPVQAVRERDPEIPDYLGEAVHRVGEAAFEALVENDGELFMQLFPPYFLGVLVIVDRIKPQVMSWQPQMASTAISEPVIDAMDLSGYAFVFSELHGNPKLWETCQTTWRRYLLPLGILPIRGTRDHSGFSVELVPADSEREARLCRFLH